MAAETQYTAKTGMVTISTANSNLDGSGTLGTVVTADVNKNGLLIKTIYLKAITNTSKGAVRLFIYDGTNTKLILEHEIPAIIKSATDPAYEAVIPLNLKLNPGWTLKASTENGESFNIIADAQDWFYYTNSIRAETTQFSHNNAATTITTANSNLNGSGTLGIALISSGCNIMSITIKAKQSTTYGMIRIFLYNNSTLENKLLMEIPVPAITRTATVPSFYHKIIFKNAFALKSGWYLKASTEKGEAFNIIPESFNWTYPA